MSGCCYSGVLVLSVVSVDFDAEVFWRQLLVFTYFFNKRENKQKKNFLFLHSLMTCKYFIRFVPVVTINH